MATIKITLTNDLLSLISNIHFEKLPNVKTTKKQELNWGINFFSLYGGDFVLEDISFIIGKYDEHIEGTEESSFGPRFSEELENYMWKMHEYIVENIFYIENLVHYYCNKGGLSEGTYKCNDYDLTWTKII